MAERSTLLTVMTKDLWQRLKPLYDAALEAPKEARLKFVAEACSDDSELRDELTALLESTDSRTWLGDSPVISFDDLFPPAPKLFSLGEVILGRFRIVRHLGTGGMGDVYEALDLELGQIALKTIRVDIVHYPNVLSRFKKEVQLARKINGTHICRIYELFVLPDDTGGSSSALLTMEFLEGLTVADKLEQSGPLPWREAQKIALEICSGLQAIHAAGIIHRDLKSRNIMLVYRNGATCAVLMDFGLARELSPPASVTQTSLNDRSAIVGTPNYMAPEQFEGRELSPATDVYAFGIVLYELLTAQHPFAASTPLEAAILRGRRPSQVSSLQPGVPRRFDEVIRKCLEFDAKRRYQSAEELAEDLRSGLFSVAWFRRKRSKLLTVAACLGLLLSILLLVPASRERIQGMLFSSREKHIAVLPFDLAEDDPETVALGDGLMDSLSGKLSNLDATNQSLWVIPAVEVRHRKVDGPSSALREFGATIAVKGKFERHDHTFKLKLTLIDTKKMREIGYADVENQSGDLAALLDEAVTRLGRLMNLSLKVNTTRERQAPTRAAYEDYLLALGYIQRFDKRGNLDLAIASLQHATKTDPNFALGFARLGEVYVLKYRLDSDPEWLTRAQEYCKQAAELDDRVPLTYVALAQIHEHTGNHDLAVQEFQRAIDLDPTDTEALSGMALSYQRAGRIPEAEATYIKAASLRPEDWSGYNNLGVFYKRIGRREDAIAQFQRAIELTPDNSSVYANLGSTYMNSNMLAEAESAYKRSISLNPTFQAYANLGNLYGIQHRFSDSITATRKALELSDRNYEVWDNLAQGYEWLGDKQQAAAARYKVMELVNRELKLNPDDADAKAKKAVLLAKEGSRSLALESIRSSLARSPNSESVLYNVADAYELLGDRVDAIRYLEQAVQKGLSPQELGSDPYLQGTIADPKFHLPGR